MSKRFLLLSDDDLESKSKKCKNDNTLKSEHKADKAFKKFLVAMGVKEENTDYWNYEEPQLDNYLAKFWFGAHKDICNDEDSQDSNVEGKERLYKANSLRSFCYGINRILKMRGHLYDITDKRTTSFQKSQQAFIDALKELKSEGKGDMEPYPEIKEQGKTRLKLNILTTRSIGRHVGSTTSD